jgi:acetyl/propionyl-CoA carboxylase alpha subunit
VRFEFTVAGRAHAVTVEGKPSSATVTIDGRGRAVDWVAIPGGVVSMVVDGRSRTARVARRDGGLSVWVDGRRFDLDLGAADDAAGAARAGGGRGGGAVKAPMPGAVVKVLVKEGDSVEVGQSLVIVEAMKMEHDVRAPVAGTVKKVAVAPGSSVGTTEAMVEIEPARADG